MIRYLKNLIHLVFAIAVAVFYGFPGRKMKVIGVTGTDGKTTTTHLIYTILRHAKEKTSMVSTIEAVINSEHIDTGFHVTSPSTFNLQKMMRKAVREGCKYFVLEVTSHGLDQYRVFGASIDVALINNISHEHIDYHKSFENYRNAKAKILRGAEISILNADDKNFDYLKNRASGKVYSYGIDNDADFSLDDFKLKPKIPGKFNLYNCLAAATVAKLLGISIKDISSTISSFEGIPGRMEEVKTNNKTFKTYIDFAHKPNALEQVLKAARLKTAQKLIVVFGCAGLRDKIKRPMMGEIALRLADYVVLTGEDPRTEDVRDIIDEIAAGCLQAGGIVLNKKDKNTEKLKTDKRYFWKIPDRQEAINFAIRNLATKGDMVLICGKGHEKSMAYGNIEYPWDEKKAILKAIYGTV